MQTFNANGTMSALFNTEDISADSWSIADGKLVINYDGGLVQTVTILDTNPANPHEYGFFHEFDGGAGRGVVYTMAVKVDPAFTFVEGDLINPAGYFWNAMINHWQVGYWNADGTIDTQNHWGWKFESLPAATHPKLDLSYDWDGNGTTDRTWEEQSITWALPADGTLELTYLGWEGGPLRVRHWIPLATDTAAGGERRMYMMEWEDQMEWEDLDGGRRINPRINMQMELMELQTPEDYDVLYTY